MKSVLLYAKGYREFLSVVGRGYTEFLSVVSFMLSLALFPGARHIIRSLKRLVFIDVNCILLFFVFEAL